MKKLIFAVLALMTITTTQAQGLDLGIKAGVNFATLTDASGLDNRTGFVAGAFVGGKLGDRFGIQADLLYSQQGAEFDAGEFNLDYVNVPIVAKIYLTDKFNLQAGPQFGVLVNDEAQTVIGEVINDIGTNEFDISGVVGIGFDVPLGLRLEGRYNFGLTDVPEERGCGTCSRCIPACPTEAITAPGVLDANKCLAWLLQSEGQFPIEFREALGDRIYGCDDCQIVCPWNSFAVKTDEEAFRERDGSRQLIELMRMDDEDFRKRFRKSPVKRTKRKGLLRNVAVALGNSGNSFAVVPLTDALSDYEPLIRAHAVWALGELLGEKALSVFDENLAGETEEMVQKEIKLVQETYG